MKKKGSKNVMKKNWCVWLGPTQESPAKECLARFGFINLKAAFKPGTQP
jgi:hypothetical protein